MVDPPPTGGGDFARDGQKTPYFTLFHQTLHMGDLPDKSSSCSYLRMRPFGLKILRYLAPWGSTPLRHHLKSLSDKGLRELGLLRKSPSMPSKYPNYARKCACDNPTPSSCSKDRTKFLKAF